MIPFFRQPNVTVPSTRPGLQPGRTCRVSDVRCLWNTRPLITSGEGLYATDLLDHLRRVSIAFHVTRTATQHRNTQVALTLIFKNTQTKIHKSNWMYAREPLGLQKDKYIDRYSNTSRNLNVGLGNHWKLYSIGRNAELGWFNYYIQR